MGSRFWRVVENVKLDHYLNLSVRMQLRRFTRLTNAFSKKLDNLKAMVRCQ